MALLLGLTAVAVLLYVRYKDDGASTSTGGESSTSTETATEDVTTETQDTDPDPAAGGEESGEFSPLPQQGVANERR
ncbi:hypothetical protein ACFQL4_02225 [Halosimplex aquaticum]